LWSVTPFEDAQDANSARDLYAAYAALAAKVIATSGTNPDPLEEEPSATQAPMCLGREPGLCTTRMCVSARACVSTCTTQRESEARSAVPSSSSSDAISCCDSGERNNQREPCRTSAQRCRSSVVHR
jgi:hypothetical protein